MKHFFLSERTCISKAVNLNISAAHAFHHILSHWCFLHHKQETSLQIGSDIFRNI